VRKKEGGSPDERGHSLWLHAWQKEIHHSPRQEGRCRPRLGGSPLSLSLSASPLAGRQNVSSYPARLPLPLLILDACSRKVVRWSMANHLKAELVTDALEMALWRRNPPSGVIHHSDRGTQYTALSFGERLKEAGIFPSMGRAGSALDNAMAESFVSTLKAEMGTGSFDTRETARTAIFDYIEGFYNPSRRHSSIGYMSPSDYELAIAEEVRVA
jgi:transposase InsO family protein